MTLKRAFLVIGGVGSLFLTTSLTYQIRSCQQISLPAGKTVEAPQGREDLHEELSVPVAEVVKKPAVADKSAQATAEKPTPVYRQPPKKFQPSGAKSPTKIPRFLPASYEVPVEIKNGKVIAQGDIFIGTTKDSRRTSGKVRLKKVKLWPKGIIPYSIEEGLENEAEVLQAIQILNESTGVQVRPKKPSETQFLAFFKGDIKNLCLSALGFQDYKNSPQPIFLAPECGVQHILHELLHTLGLIHEHSREDRDDFVEVVWDNIPDEYHLQFARIPTGLNESYKEFLFDYQSIMIYEPSTFSISSTKPSLRSRVDGKEIAPHKQGLSEGDRHKVKALYAKEIGWR